MIEARNITKIYGRGKKRVVALNDISFVLPDSGMVFVVGKSGCGKSTLLNMIGGCDKLTAGDIVMDGNAFSAFHERDYDHFRNDYVGFVFQDYCLLEGLSVAQNVALALALRGEEDDEAVREALEKVGLAECAERRPAELSGGQKQRVAIARVLVKKPKLILADEPTGNLDEKSSGVILDILKETSKTALVVIVSHNRPDAERYADRILELSEGKIVGDVSRNQNAADLVFDGQTILIQKGTVFTEEQIMQINERLLAGGARLKQTDAKFLPTCPPRPSGEKRAFTPHALNFHGAKTLFRMFAKKRPVGTIVTALTIVFLMVVMGVCQLFTKFSPDAEIQRLLTQEDAADTFIMQKGYKTGEYSTSISSDYMVRAGNEDVAAFREAGYTGGVYPLYNVPVMTRYTSGAIWEIESYRLPTDKANYSHFFCGAALGVLVTNEDFLARVYGTEGRLTLLSGRLETGDDAILVTDYVADSILAYNRNFASDTDDPYQKLTTGQVVFSRYRIAGVIATGYQTRYQALKQTLLAGDVQDADPEAYGKFITELNSTLNVAYSFNPDFLSAYLTNPNIQREVYLGTTYVDDGTHHAETTTYCRLSKTLQPGQILIKRSLYASLMGIEEADIDESEAIGKKLVLSCYDRIPQGEQPHFVREVTIAGLSESVSNSGGFYFSEVEYRLAMQFCTIPYALYFDDLTNITQLYEVGTQLNFVVRSPLVNAVYNVSKAALVFRDLFQFLIGILLLIIVATLIAFGVGSVKKNMYEIAVVRALGGKSGDIACMFFVQMLLVSVVVGILSIAGLAVGAIVCNSLLVEGFVIFAKSTLMRRLHIILFHWETALIDAALVLDLTVLAAIVPFVIMRRAKPREIIRTKE